MERINRPDNVVIENANILPGRFKNFSGAPSAYNKAGDRTFCITIDDEKFAQKMSDDGWYIRILKPRDESEEPKYYIQVKVSYQIPSLAPEIVLIKGHTHTTLTEETVGTLDYAEIKNVDLTLRPRIWHDDLGGKSGIKAYLANMYVTLENDVLAAKYATRFAEEEAPEEMPFY